MSPVQQAVAIESISRFSPNLGKEFKRGQTQHQKISKATNRLQSSKNDRPFSIQYKNNQTLKISNNFAWVHAFLTFETFTS